MINTTPPVELSFLFPDCRARRRLAHQGFALAYSEVTELVPHSNGRDLVLRGLLSTPFGKTKSYAVTIGYGEACNAWETMANENGMMRLLVASYTDEQRAEIRRLGEEFDKVEPA